MFMAIIRVEVTYEKDNTNLDLQDDFVSKQMLKTLKVWGNDVASWCLLIWIFGRSLM